MTSNADINGQRKTVLITGGAGFIGSHLVERLLADGFAVTVIDDFNDFYDPGLKRRNLSVAASDPGFRLVEADILVPTSLANVFAEQKFDVIFHLAARAGVRPSLERPLLYQKVNVEGTYALLEMARTAGVKKFIFGSSSSVYGVRDGGPFREQDLLENPASPYAASKIAGEAICRVYAHLYDMQILCLRFFTVFGPRQRPDLAINKFARLIAARSPVPLFGDGDSARDYTYVDDIVELLVRAMRYDQSRFEIINAGGEEPLRLNELIKMIGDVLGIEPVVKPMPPQAGDVPMTWADMTKATQLLGYRPQVSKREGIRRFVEWMRAEDRGR